MDPADITLTVVAIRGKLRTTSIDALSAEYADFSKTYPKLFEMCTAEIFDVAKFNYTMALLGKVSNGKRTQEDADAEYGQRMFDDFVGPLVKKK